MTRAGFLVWALCAWCVAGGFGFAYAQDQTEPVPTGNEKATVSPIKTRFNQPDAAQKTTMITRSQMEKRSEALEPKSMDLMTLTRLRRQARRSRHHSRTTLLNNQSFDRP